jgi:uncharacterized membrane protein YdjX (TVP38/TMEM64 family)
MTNRIDVTAAPARLPRAKLVAGACLVLVVCAGVCLMRLRPDDATALVRRVASLEASMGAAGWLLAFGVQTLVAVCGILPASAGAFAAGLAFGLAGGFCISAPATFIGATLAFLLARGMFRPLVARAVSRHPALIRLDGAVAKDGWRIVVLLRISPIVPFALTSYALGLTALKLRAYLIGTLASMPALLGYVALGSIAGSGFTSLGSSRNTPLHWAVLAVTFAATALLTIYLGRIIAAALRLPPEPQV